LTDDGCEDRIVAVRDRGHVHVGIIFLQVDMLKYRPSRRCEDGARSCSVASMSALLDTWLRGVGGRGASGVGSVRARAGCSPDNLLTHIGRSFIRCCPIIGVNRTFRFLFVALPARCACRRANQDRRRTKDGRDTNCRFSRFEMTQL
jgi:hypothetical protein